MKLLFASDIHGSFYWCSKLEDRLKAEKPDKLVLLGDLLYHGPRNPLPNDYNPEKVFNLLNQYKDQIIAVRGNCDSEVDQMVLDFPMMSDYTTFHADDLTIFCTHGHLFDKANPPVLAGNIALVNGHFHSFENSQQNGFRYVNIGSVSLPKDGKQNTYAIFENGKFTIKDMDGNIALEQ